MPDVGDGPGDGARKNDLMGIRKLSFARPKRKLSVFWGRMLLMQLITGVVLPAFPAGQPEFCDPLLTVIADNPYGYRPRGDRCEGIYVQNVASVPLIVASFTESTIDYELDAGKPLHVGWRNLSGNTSPVRLRAQGVKRRLYYRMDTFRPADATSYVWPSNLLTALNIQKQDIGILGVIGHPIGQTDRDIYLPLRVTQKEVFARSGPYELVLFSGLELSEIFVSLAQLRENGEPETYVQYEEPLGYGYYPAEQPITVRIPGLNRAGIYRLEIGSIIRGGGTFSLSFWFYHADR